ncbi:hypothetical protein Herod_00052 [Acinetobacter phage Herod]|nr:hypothetical protein Herod_00052 [Acinetobacter phage Herod]
MIIYGKWVSSYRDGDLVQFIPRDCGRVLVGKLKLNSEYYNSEKSTIVTEEDRAYRPSEILVLSPYNSYYINNQDDLYDVILESYLGSQRSL